MSFVGEPFAEMKLEKTCQRKGSDFHGIRKRPAACVGSRPYLPIRVGGVGGLDGWVGGCPGSFWLKLKMCIGPGAWWAVGGG